MPFKTYLFDFDGTLANTAPAIVQCFQQTLAEAGFSVPHEHRIRALIGAPQEEMFAKLEPQCDPQKCATEYRKKYAEIALEIVQLFAGTREMLQQLKKNGAQLAIVSTKSREAITAHLQHWELEKYFKIVLGRQHVSKQKPDPEGITLAMQKLNAQAAETIMIGDTILDIVAAKNAEIQAGLVGWSNQNVPEILQQSTMEKTKITLISSWTELTKTELTSQNELRRQTFNDQSIY